MPRYSREIVDAYTDFALEVRKIYETKGLEYILSKTKGVTQEEIETLINPKNIDKILIGVPLKYKEQIVKYKEIFTQADDNKDIIHNLLYALMPPSVKQMKKEILEYVNHVNPKTGKKRTWVNFEDEINDSYSKRLNRQGVYFYINGYHYPNRESIMKLKKILSEKTVNGLLRELYDIDTEKLQIEGIEIEDITVIAKDWSDDEKDSAILYLINSYYDKKAAIKTLKKALFLLGNI